MTMLHTHPLKPRAIDAASAELAGVAAFSRRAIVAVSLATAAYLIGAHAHAQPCTRHVECPGFVVWNDLSALPNGSTGTVAVPIPGWVPTPTLTLTSTTGTTLGPFTPPATLGGSFRSSLDSTLGWPFDLPYVDLQTTMPMGATGTVRYEFMVPASVRGPGFRYVVGVGGTAGAPNEGPVTIVSDADLTPLGVFDAFGSGRIAMFLPPRTLVGSAGAGADGLSFFLLPAATTTVSFSVTDRSTSGAGDSHGYVLGVVDPTMRLYCNPVPRMCTPPFCGDGVVGMEELCDDGNSMPGDGCSMDCLVEPGFECAPGPPSMCRRIGGPDGGSDVASPADVTLDAAPDTPAGSDLGPDAATPPEDAVVPMRATVQGGGCISCHVGTPRARGREGGWSALALLAASIALRCRRTLAQLRHFKHGRRVLSRT